MSELVLSKRENGVLSLFLNKPQTYNAFDLELIQMFADRLITAGSDDSIRVVVVGGEGKAFCAGGDLGHVSRHPVGRGAALHELAARFHLAIMEIRRMPKPVIAAIEGPAAGGGFSLALACDFRVMSESAVLRQAYTSNGLCIDGGGSFTLPRLVGMAKALEIAAFDEPINAEKAMQLGLVTKVVPKGSALAEAKNMAEMLAAKSINSFAWSKQLLNDSFDSSLETQMEKERTAIQTCGGHKDGLEGVSAFVEKRKPDFTG